MQIHSEADHRNSVPEHKVQTLQALNSMQITLSSIHTSMSKKALIGNFSLTWTLGIRKS